MHRSICFVLLESFIGNLLEIEALVDEDLNCQCLCFLATSNAVVGIIICLVVVLLRSAKDEAAAVKWS